MSLSAACGWACLRSVVLALLALPWMFLLNRWLKSAQGLSGRVIWCALLAPFFVPELLVGYAYSNFSLSLIRQPAANEVFYALLIALKFIPVGTLAIYFAPPAPLSPEGRHCRLLALREPGRNSLFGTARPLPLWMEDLCFGPGRSAFAAFAVVFLLVFQEFEIASLLGTRSWTRWLFDMQAGGLILSESWRFVKVPLVWEAAILIPALFVILKTGGLPAAAIPPVRPPGWRIRVVAGCYLSAALLMVCVIPACLVLRGSGAALGLLWQERTVQQGLVLEILRSGVTALVSGVSAFAIVRGLFGIQPARIHGGLRLLIAVALAVPGLLGSLVLSLSLLHLFQLPWLHSWYDTPLPLVLAQVLLLLPRALLLQILLGALRPGEGAYLAKLLRASPILRQRQQGQELSWELSYRGDFWSLVVLCYWGYLDLTAASLLAPSGMVTAPVRLYNLMHYGQSALLSGMLSATIIAPLLLLSWILILRRPLWSALQGVNWRP